jgi:hypothetical protein
MSALELWVLLIFGEPPPQKEALRGSKGSPALKGLTVFGCVAWKETLWYVDKNFHPQIKACKGKFTFKMWEKIN